MTWFLQFDIIFPMAGFKELLRGHSVKTPLYPIGDARNVDNINLRVENAPDRLTNNWAGTILSNTPVVGPFLLGGARLVEVIHSDIVERARGKEFKNLRIPAAARDELKTDEDKENYLGRYLRDRYGRLPREWRETHHTDRFNRYRRGLVFTGVNMGLVALALLHPEITHEALTSLSHLAPDAVRGLFEGGANVAEDYLSIPVAGALGLEAGAKAALLYREKDELGQLEKLRGKKNPNKSPDEGEEVGYDDPVGMEKEVSAAVKFLRFSGNQEVVTARAFAQLKIDRHDMRIAYNRLRTTEIPLKERPTNKRAVSYTQYDQELDASKRLEAVTFGLDNASSGWTYGYRLTHPLENIKGLRRIKNDIRREKTYDFDTTAREYVHPVELSRRGHQS